MKFTVKKTIIAYSLAFKLSVLNDETGRPFLPKSVGITQFLNP